MRKENSTNAYNEKQILNGCGMAVSLSIIGGRWKPAILCRLAYGAMRYSELRDSIGSISERMLVSQLRELEKDKIVERIVYPEVPPRVEYKLTEIGMSMRPMLDAMSDWGNEYREKVDEAVTV